MAELTLKVNGNVVKTGEKYEQLRLAIFGISTTKNVDSVTVKNSLDLLGGVAFADVFEKADGAKPDDKIEVYEDGTLKARYTRKNLAQRMRIASTVDNWNGEIFTEKSAKKSGTVETQVIEAF